MEHETAESSTRSETIQQKAKRYGRETGTIHLETQVLQDELLFGMLAIRTVVTTVV